MEHIKITLKGKYSLYAEIVADYGYCFYDADDEERIYMTYIATPITDATELARKYIVVQGDAEKLNKALKEESEVQDGK